MRPLPAGPLGRLPIRGEGTARPPRSRLNGRAETGVHIGLDEIRADEFSAMLIIAEERDLLDREKFPGWRGNRPT